jgi:ornithine carbamoyltransferase
MKAGGKTRAAIGKANGHAKTNGTAAVVPGGARHFLDLSDIPAGELRRVLELSKDLKARRRAGDEARPLAGKSLAMVFDKPSTRTRVSFDLAMRQLGGETIMLTGQEMQLGRGESIADTARVLSRFVDAIMIRILEHDDLMELAAYATVPVINGLTRLSHPCQVMADVMTFEEHRGPITGRKVAWTGDFNNVLASWIHAAERFDFAMTVATPKELPPSPAIRDFVKRNKAKVTFMRDPEEAVEGADCVLTDTWVSMGDEEAERLRHNLLKPYQVNAALMARAHKDAIFMHCLPAHRGEEVTDEVMDGPQSVVFDEAENRLHAQKGILAWCFDAAGG